MFLTSHQPSVRLCFEHGVDECLSEKFELSEQGATFESAWEFPLFAEVSLRCSRPAAREGGAWETLCGVVVACRRSGVRSFETTLFFPEPLAEAEERAAALAA